MRELLLFVRPPRPMWPFNGEGTAFWPPLAFASMAGALRQEIPEIELAILDAPALRMGWKSLEQELRRLSPRWIGIGEEAVSCTEGLRLARLAKALGATVMAGGCFFGQVAPQALATGLIDIVVHGEGERTIVELVRALREGSGPCGQVRGISYRHGDEVVFTGARELISSLDDLPMPAYDLLPCERYGGRNHPALAALELSRGCTHECEFCVLWRQMGRLTPGGKLAPALRAKSPERVREEVLWVTRHFGRRYIGWVDPCFNAHPRAACTAADLLVASGIRIGQSAWMRADCVLRDLKSGTLDACVRSGLNEVYIGVERLAREELVALKKDAAREEVTAALVELRRRYPEVFVVASVIYGLEHDTNSSVRRLSRDAYRLPVDEIFFIPQTPLPGTSAWRPDMWDPNGGRFRDFDFLPRPDGDARLASLTRSLYWSMYFGWSPQRLGNWARGLLSSNARRRRLTRRLLGREMPFVASNLARSLMGRPPRGMRVPGWYEG